MGIHWVHAQILVSVQRHAGVGIMKEPSNWHRNNKSRRHASLAIHPAENASKDPRSLWPTSDLNPNHKA